MRGGAPPRLVLFDCDGTLVDSQHAIVAAMALAFAEGGLPVPDSGAVRHVVGLSLEQAIGLLLPDGAVIEVERIADSYRSRHFDEVGRALLFPGVREGLSRLTGEGLMLGICTGKGMRGLGVVLDALGLRRHFITLQTADRHPGKPNPAMVEAALAEVGIEAADTVLVGDTSYDMELALNAGVVPIGVSWGYHDADSLIAAGAAAVVDSFAELERMLLATASAET